MRAMDTQKKNDRFHARTYRVPLFLFLQLLISFLVACSVSAQLRPDTGLSLSLLIGSALGLALTFNLVQGMFALQVALDRRVHDLPVDLRAIHRYWPLRPLFLLAHDLEIYHGEHTQFEKQAGASKDQMQQMIETTAQEERNRLARDLHDSIKQQIFSITMSAAAAKARWEADLSRVRSILDDIEETAHEAQVEMQALLQQLRPQALENTGLVQSLRMQGQALEYRTGAKVLVEIGSLPAEDLLPLGSQEVLFRIVQEGFSNIARHARASTVWLSLYQQEDFLLLEIGDDGQGFDLDNLPANSGAGGMGTRNVHDRIQALGGTAQVWSRPAEGTTLQIVLPLVSPVSVESAPEDSDPELILAGKQAQNFFSVGIVLIGSAAACILFSMPQWLALPWITLSMLLAGVCLLGAQILRMRVDMICGRQSSLHLELVTENYKLLIALIVLGLFLVGYLRYDWLSIWLIAPVLICVLLLSIRYFKIRGRILRGLSLTALREQISQQRMRLGLDSLIWVLTVGLVIIMNMPWPGLENFQLSQDYWRANASALLCLIWLGINLLKGIEIVYVQRVIARRASDV